MKQPKYYFVYYECEICGWNQSGMSTGSNEVNSQCIIDIHPIQFQLDCNEKYGSEKELSNGHKKREEYKVISWQELTLEEYKEYKGKVG
jgi:hypothetical protein